MKTPARQHGVALLTVLLLVLVMSTLLVGLLDDIRFGLRRSSNVETVAQARWDALAAEAFARRRIDAIAGLPSIADAGGGRRSFALPVEQGLLEARVEDASHCFNLNSVVQGANEFVVRRDNGIRQYRALLQALDIPEAHARQLADTLVDWIDGDQQPQPHGHEDAAYRSGGGGYLTASTRLAEPSELRALRGYDADTYARLRPWVCTLPTHAPTPLNVNTLLPTQAPLLVMLTAGGLDIAAARSLIATRPASGWPDAAAFWREPPLQALALDNDTLAQAATRPRLFRLHVEVTRGPARLVLASLLEHGTDGRTRLLARQWNTPE